MKSILICFRDIYSYLPVKSPTNVLLQNDVRFVCTSVYQIIIIIFFNVNKNEIDSGTVFKLRVVYLLF